MAEQIEVIDWISWEESEQLPEAIGGLGGWFGMYEKGLRWKAYSDGNSEHFQKYAEAIRRNVLKHKLRTCGDEHQTTMVPLFSDGSIASFSYRGWGDLMAAIWSEEEDKDYCYMDFYMRGWP